MDTLSDAAIFLHKSDGSNMQFVPSGKGLYHHALRDEVDAWVMINTVAGLTEFQPKRALSNSNSNGRRTSQKP